MYLTTKYDFRKKPDTKPRPDNINERGSVFFSIMAAVGMVAVLSYGLVQFIQGPLKTATNVNRRNVAETQMQMSAKIAALTAAEQAANGDCDADAFVEPVPYKDAGASPKPSGGGLLPDTMGTQKRDPWGSDYGYCVWDHGPKIADAGCGGGTQKRLAGTNASSWETLAVISAGPDRTFQTVCNPWLDTNADSKPDSPLVNKPGTSDDVVFTWTYAEAGAAAAGLWKLKANDPAKATIGKDLEVTGGAEFSGALTLTQRGLILPGDPGDNSITGACSLANDQQLRRNTSTAPPTLEICYESAPSVWTWEGVSGGGSDLWTQEANDKIHYDTANVGIGVADPVSKFEVNGNIKVGGNSTTCDATTKGSYRFDTADNKYKFCDGTQWVRFAEVQAATTPPTAPVNNAYFVLTQTSWNGNLGGAAGADTKCLTELTTNTAWKGYASALAAGQLTSSNVKAWLCTGGYGCNNLMPLTNYYFAKVGDSSAGGAYFTTDSQGRGPYDSTVWSAANRFNGTHTYWTNRGPQYCDSPDWDTGGGTGCNGNWVECWSWTSSSSSDNGGGGNSSAAGTGSGRYGAAFACNTTNRLICMVNPASGTGCGGNGTITGPQNTTLQIPAGCSVTFKAWGAGGGSGGTTTTRASGTGGGGGYATITMTPAATTTYYISAGGPGGSGVGTGTTSAGGNGGSGATGFAAGNGGAGISGSTAGGGGGGAATSICIGNYCGSGSNTVVLVAGGGGGGGSGGTGVGQAGLAGGQAGSTLSGSSGGGTGITNAGGGGGGGAAGCNNATCTNGGGAGGSNPNIGGSGGQSLATSTLTGHTVTSSGTAAGSGQSPGNSGDANRGTNGNGAASVGATGGNGLNGSAGAVYYVIF